MTDMMSVTTLSNDYGSHTIIKLIHELRDFKIRNGFNKTARLKIYKDKSMPFLSKKLIKTVFKRESQASTIFK